MANQVRVLTFNVEHGNCHAIWSPTGKVVVIDLGRSDNFSPIEWLKSIGVSAIDLLVISHPHDDHLRGLRDLDNMAVRVLHRPRNIPADLISELDADLKKKWEFYDGTFTSPVSDASRFYDRSSPHFDGLSLTFWGGKSESTNLNNYSVVVILEYARLKMIFPGDLEQAGWAELLAQKEFCAAISDANILVAPHHGREAGWCVDIFKHFSPHLIIVSDGAETETSYVSQYSQQAKGAKVKARKTNQVQERKVISTRDNGHINVCITPVQNGGWEFMADVENH